MPAPQPLSMPMAWDLVSADYATELVPMFEPHAERALALCGVTSATRVVDVATGPGTLALLAAARGAKVTAIDFAPSMIAQLGARAAKASLAIDARVGDGQALPFADAAFDAGFSMFGLMFFPDRARGFAELRRTVRGPVAVATWKPFAPASPLAVLMSALRDALPDLAFGDGRAPLGDEGELRSEMSAAGFADVALHDCVSEQRAPSRDDFWASLVRTFAPIALLKSRLGEGWPAASADIRARVARSIGEGPVTLPMISTIAVGQSR